MDVLILLALRLESCREDQKGEGLLLAGILLRPEGKTFNKPVLSQKPACLCFVLAVFKT